MSWRNGKVPNMTRWRRERLRALERDGYRCVQCGRAGRLEVDHIKPLGKGGALYAMGNLQALCRGCHIAKTAGENNTRPLSPEAAAQVEAWRKLIAERLSSSELAVDY